MSPISTRYGGEEQALGDICDKRALRWEKPGSLNVNVEEGPLLIHLKT